MADFEEMPKQDEVDERKDANETTVPAEQIDLVADDTASSAKSPSKSPAKSPKKAAEEKKSSPAKSAKSSPTKSPVKSPKKSKKEGSDEEEEDEEEEEMKGKKGILDMPLVIEGKRKRESTSFLKVEENLAHKHKAPPVAGSGTALEDIPFIVHQLDNEKKVDDLRPLYRICYGTRGKANTLKRELKKFNGFSFTKDSDEFNKKQVLVSKHTSAELAHARRILGLAASHKKEEQVQTIMDFLVKPHDEGKSVPKKAASKRKSSGKGKTLAKKSEKESSSKKKKTSSKETVDTESDEDDKSSESDEDEEQKAKEEEDMKKTPKKAAPKKRKAVDQNPKSPSKKAKKAASEGDDHSVTSSSDDSSEKKEEKPEITPSDKELKAKITELLKTFDLTSVSMKQMVLAVCEAFPDHPTLNERTSSIKAFIKDAIKEVE